MAEFTELELILDYRTLIEVYQDFGRQMAGPNPLFDLYTSVPAPNVDTDVVEFVKLGKVKDPAPTNRRGNPARKLQPTGKGRATLAMLNAFDTIQLGMDSLQMLRHPEQWALQSRGKEEIQQQLEDFGMRHLLTKYLWLAKHFSGQAIYIDVNGDIQETLNGTTTTEVTVENGVPSTNVGQVAKSGFGISGGGNVFDIAWDAVDSDGYGTAKILDQLDMLCVCCEIAKVPPIRHIWLNGLNSAWIRRNKQIIDHYGTIGGRRDLDAAIAAGELKIGPYTFHFFAGTYTDVAGGDQFYIPITKALMTPDPKEGGWLTQRLGLQLVPSDLNITPSSGSGLPSFGNWTENYGDFAYILPDHNPPSVHIYSGFNWLFGFKQPAAVFPVTVDF